ncbi:MAG TPA: glycosyltransferase family 9 protein, partial [Tepidisphaeraceae bacterium]|nr:glycosyltransferase family 9 protein [Tepidisphaeraceae bacterium]
SDLRGRRILIHSEQGLGDTMQFIRFAPMLAERGGRVIFFCHMELARLLQNFPHLEQFVPFGQPLPEADVHSPLLSLPNALKIAGRIPAPHSYITPEENLVRKWSQRLPASGVRVGIAWAGRPDHRNDRNRSMPLKSLARLFEIPGVHFFSLQKGPSATQIKELAIATLTDWTNELTDFAETAALIASLDLVIAVDTAVVHLAGAMGKPVWILLPYVPDWRWMLDRTDSPWYPTARLFRQSSRGDWSGVVDRVAEALRLFDPGPTSAPRGPATPRGC